MTISQFSFPTRIQSGPGAVGLVGGALLEAGKKRPLIVTDRGLAPLAPVTETQRKLAADGLEVAVFSGIWGNPVKSQVLAGVDAFRAHGADSIVGLGGGAALDVAKAILVMVNHPGDLFDYEDDKPGARPIDREIPYWVSVPTTAGTGSEVGRSSVVSDDETHVKKIIFSPRLLAQRVFLDPELTLRLPAGVTAATGMDALTHLVESYLAKDFHPLCDGIALSGLSIVAQSLAPAVEYARRLEAGDHSLLADAGARRGARRDAERRHDGRRGVPKRPRRHALARARALDRVRSAPRARERRGDSVRDGVQRRRNGAGRPLARDRSAQWPPWRRHAS